MKDSAERSLLARRAALALVAVALALPSIPAGSARAAGPGSPQGVFHWERTGDLLTALVGPVVVTLRTGSVLVVGGWHYAGNARLWLSKAELFDPAAGTWRKTRKPKRAGSSWPKGPASATLLEDGRVLLAGGRTTVAEIYDPATEQWRPAGDMRVSRSGPALLRLPGGRVLVAGGHKVGGKSTYQIYDPSTATFTDPIPTDDLPDGAAMIALADGRVLVAGGVDAASGAVTGAARVFDPASGAWAPTGSLATARKDATAVLLPRSGKVLIVGGNDGSGWDGFLTGAELYDPATGAWQPTGSLRAFRFNFTAVALDDDRVLVAEGSDVPSPAISVTSSSEIYDPAAGVWSDAGTTSVTRTAASAARLADGRVLVFGGLDGRAAPLATSEIYTP